MLRRLTASDQLTTISVLFAIILLGIKVGQVDLPRPTAPTIHFTCAVAVHSLEGEVCISGPAGASVSIDVRYCDGTQVSSPPIRTQVAGEYRWLWHVETSCWGPGAAWAKAMAIWPGNVQAEALAIFDVA